MREAAEEADNGGYEESMRDYMRDLYPGAMGQSAGVQKQAGFVITIEGYSPYRRIGNLLDPPNVKEDRSRWGFTTRLENLKDYLPDVNFPSEIYKKDDPLHYKLETGPADPDGDVPKGVGDWRFIPDPPAPGTAATPGGNAYMMSMAQRSGTWILVDPMTKETISAEAVKDQYGNLAYDATAKPKKIVHDYWFKLQFKLVWKDAPKSAAPAPTVTTPVRRPKATK